LLGAGHLGQALLHYFQATEPHLEMKAVFEVDSKMVGKHLLDVPVLHVSMLESHLKSSQVRIAILALPPEEAQKAADQLVASGVCSILNFTPIRLQVPDHIFVENNDIQMSLERVGFYAQNTISGESRA